MRCNRHFSIAAKTRPSCNLKDYNESQKYKTQAPISLRNKEDRLTCDLCKLQLKMELLLSSVGNTPRTDID